MALILCIETGTDICSVGIVRDGELIALRESDEGRDHATKIAVFTSELLAESGISGDELDAVAIGKGPGSYTGLRIGVSFAKGLCYGLGIPLIAINSLESMARVAIEDYEAGIIGVDDWQRAVLCPMVDARRMEVYVQLFDSEAHALNEVAAEIIDEQSFAAYRTERPFVIFGNGAAKCREVLGATAISVLPSVRGMARLAEEAFQRGDFVDTAYFEPFYLKDFVVTTTRKPLF